MKAASALFTSPDLVSPRKYYLTLPWTWPLANETPSGAKNAIVDVLFESRHELLYSLAENAVLHFDEIVHRKYIDVLSPVAGNLPAKALLLFGESTVLDKLANILERDSRVPGTLQWLCFFVELTVQIGDMKQWKTPDLVKPFVRKRRNQIEREIPILKHASWDGTNLIFVTRRTEIFAEIIVISESVSKLRDEDSRLDHVVNN